MGLHAHQRYLAECGVPQDFDDLMHVDLIGLDKETPVIRSVNAAWPRLNRANFSLRTDSAPAQLAAIGSGFGIGYCQTRIAARFPERVSVLGEQLAVDVGMWVVMHQDLRSDRACWASFQALGDGLGAWAVENIEAKSRLREDSFSAIRRSVSEISCVGRLINCRR